MNNFQNRSSNENMKLKLAIIVTHPIQHFAPVYRSVAQKNLIDIVVFYLTSSGAQKYFDKQFNKNLAWDIDLLEGYNYKILRPRLNVVPKGILNTDAPEISNLLDEENPDAILIYGYTRMINWRAWWWVKLRKKKLFYCSDSVLHRKRTRWRLWIKKALLPYFFKSVDFFLVAGDCNSKYFSHYGVPSERILKCPLPVDTIRLRNAVGVDSISFRKQKREELNLLPNDFVVMMCGKLYTNKRPFDLLRATFYLREQGLSIVALFVGSGELLDDLKHEAKNCTHSEAFIFTGFINQTALPLYYNASDVLVIPSSEDAHPLVATEAALFGLPLIVSDAVGCIGPSDVAQDGVNTLTYPCGDVLALADKIRYLQSFPKLKQSMGAASSEIAQTQDVSVAARAIENALLGVSAY
jgi:glycosyltransferase involved in cell wall biosynthesis